MEIVTAIVTPVVQSLMVSVKNHLRYLISCTKYVADMRTKIRVLNDARLDVEDHENRNKSNSLEVPKGARSWLQEVEKIDAQMKSINSTNVDSCFNLKGRHKLGRKACKIIQNVDRLMEEKSSIDWTEIPIPLAQVNFTPTPSSDYSDFESRKAVYTEAFNVLKADNKTHMIALCGMGGIGKTAMMEKLHKVVCESKMFDFVIKVSIGEKMNVSEFLQTAVAEQLAIDLKESTKEARVGKLRNAFKKKSKDGKKKFLVILDDLWQSVDLKDIGLSPKPDQGIDFKVLITSRDRDVCIHMGVELDSVFNLEIIEDSEAHAFFFQFVKILDDGDLRNIGRDITIRCRGLPIAIKTVARTLNGKSKHVWEDTLSKLEHKDVGEVTGEVFAISYEHLANEETKSTLLLCGLFPEDFDTPTEDLVRYAWGLNLFRNVETITKARNRLNTCIDQLIHANLLIRSQKVRCVKMHDLVLAFVLDVCSEGEHASLVGNMLKWSTKLKRESCKRISLTCEGMHDFPKNLKYPNLSLLKLMRGDESLRFPENFYDEMKNIKVIAYEKMEYPLHFRSLQYSANLRTLCLHECSLMSDCSSIGNLSNLEVLSFAHSSISELPSNIVNLKELKLLDLTRCWCLCIDGGILKSLVKLEELYMTGVRRKVNAEGDELFEGIKNLHVLEIELFDKDALPQNMSFKNLKRFKISLGCHLDKIKGITTHSLENTLMLSNNECEQLLDSEMNELVEKTKVLYLHMNGINDLGDGLGASLHNLIVLHINECTNLKYLFTIGVANGLKQLEHLTIDQCPVLETLVEDSHEICEAKVITFPALKFLTLKSLPMLTSMYKVGDVIQLPKLEELELDWLPNLTSIYQIFLKKEVMNSKLKKLGIFNMEKLEEIWPSQLSNNDQVMTTQLRVIEVRNCDSLVNLFPSNPMSLLHHLEELTVEYCDSIEVIFNPLSNNDQVITSQLRVIKVSNCNSLMNLFPSNPMSLLHHLEELTVINCDSIDVIFNIDLESSRVAEIEEGISSNLRHIELWYCGELREVWRVKGVNNSNLPILGFQAVEHIRIWECKRLRNVFTPTTSNFDMKALTGIYLISNAYKVEEINVVAFPSYLIHTVRHLHTLHIRDYTKVEAVFEIESPNSRKLTTTLDNQQPLALFYLELYGMERMTHVWKYDWNQFLISQQEPISSSFLNLTTITLEECHRIKYLFSPFMAKLLSNLNSITIYKCYAIEEVVSNIDDEYEEIVSSISSHTNTTFFPHLESLHLYKLESLKRIDGVGAKYGDNRLDSVFATSFHDISKCSEVGVAYSSFCRYLRKIRIRECDALLNVIPSHVVGQMPKLEELKISGCNSLREIFESEAVNEDVVGDVTDIGKVNGDMGYAMTKILRSTNTSSLELLLG